MPVHHHIFVPNERQKRKQLENLQKRVDNFSYRASKELRRKLKLVQGLAQRRASKLVKNCKADGQEKVKAAETLSITKKMPIDVIVGLLLVKDLGFSLDIVLAQSNRSDTNKDKKAGFGRQSSTSPDLNSTAGSKTLTKSKKTNIQDLILEPLNSRERKMAIKWSKDTRVLEAVESLRNNHRELKRTIRHMRDRLSRKEKREAVKLDPSLKVKKKSKPVGLPSQKDLFQQTLGESQGNSDYYMPQITKKKKNRMGQRARRKLAEARERCPNRSERRQGHKSSRSQVESQETALKKRASDTGTSNAHNLKSSKRQRLQSHGLDKTDASSNHPSWAARSKAKEKEKNASFAGQKKTFSDSESDNE